MNEYVLNKLNQGKSLALRVHLGSKVKHTRVSLSSVGPLKKTQGSSKG